MKGKVYAVSYVSLMKLSTKQETSVKIGLLNVERWDFHDGNEFKTFK